MTKPSHHQESATATASTDREPAIIYDPVAARHWLLDGAADEHGIDTTFSATKLSIAGAVEALLAVPGDGGVPGVWTIRLPLTTVLLWRTADGDGGIATVELTINGQPIRLDSHHRGFDGFTQRSDTSGIEAAVEALGHVADLVAAEVRRLRQALTPTGVCTVLGVWQDDAAVRVGVIAGRHEVTGGDSGYEQGLWAVTVEAPDVDTAERLAIEQMRAR